MVTRWWLALAVLVAGAAACPEHCACFTDQDGYRSANCSTLALGTVAPSSLDLLSFQPHQPGYSTRLTPRAFTAFRRVKFLWLTNCSVLGLPNEVFQGLDFIIKMDLSYNKIRHLNGGVFKSLSSLHTLLLRGNPLALTPWDVIVSDSLQELDLGHCGIRTIPQGTFISVPRLSRLYLDGNQIYSFTFNMIPAGLRYLNLAHNRIVNVPTDVLTTMSFLRKLDLSKNPIRCNCALLIMQDWFSGQGIIFENGVMCSEPTRYAGHQLSKINENELCSLEEVKRQRKINDIENYRDSKAHRINNMIHDPDLQSDQPDGDLYSEVLFDNEGTRVLGTHMELNKPPYVPPSDFSDENNRLAASKHDLGHSEMAILSPTVGLVDKVSHKDNVDFSSEILYLNSTDSISENSTEDLSIIKHGSFPKNLITESIIKNTTDHIFSKATFISELPTDSPESEMADEGYSPFYSSTSHSILDHEEYMKILNDSLLDGALSDEGYTPANNITQEEEEAGSGDEELEIKDFSISNLQNNDTSSQLPSSTQPYSWSTSNNESNDYSYDTQHDYSGEEHVTQAVTTELFEGSGASEDDDAVNKTAPPYLDDDETSSDGYLKVETSTYLGNYSDSTESSFSSSVSPNTSIETSSSDHVTDLADTEESTTENSEFSSSESPTSIASSPESIVPVFDTSSTLETIPSSSTETVHAPTYTPEITTTPSPPLSSSSEFSLVPVVVEKEFVKTTFQPETIDVSSPRPKDNAIPESTTPELEPPAVNEVEIISKVNKDEEKEQIKVEAKQSEKEAGRMEATQSTLTYVIAGLLVVLILLVIATVVCKKMLRMGPCTTKKKVRLPKDTEANHGTEMQDMLLPKPPENGVKIIPQNGTPNGKEIKEEEVPVLQKDWEEKPEPIETVTARMSILAGPQTPVFIHKTLA